MSISSLTSPPPSTQIAEKNSRRVRFSLPEAKLTLTNDKRTVHGTSKYVNGTLINVTSTIHSTNVDSIVKSSTNGIHLKSSCLKGNGNSIPNGKEASQYKLALNIRPTSAHINGTNDLQQTTATTITIPNQGQRHSLPSAGSVNGNGTGRRRMCHSLVNGRNEKYFNTLPIIGNSSVNALERKSLSLDDDFDEDSSNTRDDMRRDDRVENKMAVTNLTKYKSTDDLRDPNNFKIKNSSVIKLPEAGSNGMRNNKSMNSLKVPDYSESK